MIDAALILAISVILVLLNLYLLDRVTSQLTDIDEIRANKLELVTRMKSIIRERSIVMVDMTAEKDVWAIQDKYLYFYRLANDFIETRDQLVQSDISASEKKILENILLTIRNTENMQNDIVDRIRNARMEDGSITGILHEISTNDFPVEFKLLGQMEELYDKVVYNSNQQRLAAKKGYQQTVIVIGSISILFILATILLMARSLRRIKSIELGLLEKTESLNWDATHDPLTNVFNRRWLEHKIEFLLEKNRDGDTEHSLLYIDLDGFKQINDNYGHAAGDNYLVQFCREVEHTIRQNDVFCRMGGDEFAILLENCTEEVSLKIANELLHRISRFELEYEGNRLNASCSIGLCQFRNTNIDFDDLVHRADELCYEAKSKGKNRIEMGTFS